MPRRTLPPAAEGCKQSRTHRKARRPTPSHPAPPDDAPAKARNLSPAARRDRFLRQAGDLAQFTRLFDHLPHLAFFAKDRDLRLVLASARFCRHLGFADASGLLGRDDFALFPRPLAEKFRADDEWILRNAAPITNRVELFLSQQGIPDWFITQKLPVLDRNGSPCGVMGVVQPYDRERSLVTGDAAALKAANLFREDPGRRWQIPDVARHVGLSPRHFDRKFKDSFGVGPQAYLLKTRIHGACEALREPGARIADIALRLGFCDQSAFTAQFRQQMGLTPLRYQKQYRRQDQPPQKL
jgi:AraC-like DNA-binding protein